MNPASIDQPLNREVLLYLMVRSAVHHLSDGTQPTELPAFTPEEVMELGSLRTHPDLGGVLSALGDELPGVMHGYVLGCDVLVNQKGVIFAVAVGMLELDFRSKPPAGGLPALPDGSARIETLSDEWHGFCPFGETGLVAQLKPLAAAALANADRLAEAYAAEHGEA
ncbi:MAG TPA: hypothetical protein VHO48_10895 [Anaerolineaceae bacterium]|nr:hypothetical protein [Anaerolineaceae bacterium]